MTLIHSQLRRIAATRMAGERSGQTLQPTALVHEAWLRLGDRAFENRGHFFAAAAEAMRRIDSVRIVSHFRRVPPFNEVK